MSHYADPATLAHIAELEKENARLTLERNAYAYHIGRLTVDITDLLSILKTHATLGAEDRYELELIAKANAHKAMTLAAIEAHLRTVEAARSKVNALREDAYKHPSSFEGFTHSDAPSAPSDHDDATGAF